MRLIFRIVRAGDFTGTKSQVRITRYTIRLAQAEVGPVIPMVAIFMSTILSERIPTLVQSLHKMKGGSSQEIT